MAVDLQTRMLTAGPAAVQAAAQCLRTGGLVAFPTETVYGLGADATDGRAVARLYAAKGRPSFNPLIAHVADQVAARALGRFNRDAERLAGAFWPGPLTLVLPKTPACPVAELATAGLDSIGLRVPDHPVAQAILRKFAGPVVAPSANQSGHLSPTTAQHVAADLGGRIDLIVDGGAAPVGVESTIVACIGPTRLLRPGGIARRAIEVALGHPIGIEREIDTDADTPPAPGMGASHYAPRARVRLNAESVNPGEALLAFGPNVPQGAVAVMNLSPRGDLEEAAANLFAYLRALDGRLSGLVGPSICVMRIPSDGLGEAINDRLRRAAAPRSSS